MKILPSATWLLVQRLVDTLNNSRTLPFLPLNFFGDGGCRKLKRVELILLSLQNSFQTRDFIFVFNASAQHHSLI